jgi:outer membrane protein assembly factor BamB
LAPGSLAELWALAWHDEDAAKYSLQTKPVALAAAGSVAVVLSTWGFNGGMYNSSVLCVDADSGKIKWSAETGVGYVEVPPAAEMSGSGALIVPSPYDITHPGSYNATAFNQSNGALLWSTLLPGTQRITGLGVNNLADKNGGDIAQARRTL